MVNHFMSVIRRTKKVPNIIRADKGTENVFVKRLQRWLTGRKNSFKCGKSVHNQRIEALWSRLKLFKLTWWINFFKSMENLNILDINSDLQLYLVIFCFLPVIQMELREFQNTWNLRHVRQSARAPAGKPEVLFNMPELVGFKCQSSNLEPMDMEAANDVLRIDSIPIAKDIEYHELFLCYIRIHGLHIPTDAEDALDIFVKLLNLMKADGL